MTDIEIQLKYIRDKLAFLSSKVERDNAQGLYDINKIYENVFLHLFNCCFDYKLEDANRKLHTNFPAIDLIDHTNKLVIQVTSTLSTQKIYSSIDKLKQLKDISTYKLKMCYIVRKPKFTDKELENIEKRGLTTNDFLGIDDISTIAHSYNEKRKAIYNLLLQRIDSKAFNLDVESHFEKFEAQLNKETTNKFGVYNDEFHSFIESDSNILEVYAVGGNGKSHLLKHLASLQNKYIPVLFTKLDNVEADLKSLDIAKQYLLIYDDIDRFLDNGIDSIFSFLISSNSKIIISYRAASKYLVEDRISKFNALKSKKLYITWKKNEIRDLILLLRPDSKENEIEGIDAQFNSNPYLITQAIKGNIDELKKFSNKTLKDSISSLQKYHIPEVEVQELLFKIALLSPCPKSLISDIEKEYINELIKVGILRELNNKIRFNPDMLGDLYLVYFVKENEAKYKKIVSQYIENHLELIITNLSYIFAFESNNSLEIFFKDIINNWLSVKDFKSSNLKILYRIVDYAPIESFLYLEKVTKTLIAKENERQKHGGISDLISKISPVDFNVSDEFINLGSIVPIINIMIYKLKNDKDLGRLKIKDIVKFLVAPEILSFPEPYFANHNISSVFNDMLIPYETKSNNSLIEALEEMKKWLGEKILDSKKITILKIALENLLEGTVKHFHFNKNLEVEFDISKENIKKVLDKAKEITLYMFNSSEFMIIDTALDILNYIGKNVENSNNKQYYKLFINEAFAILEKQITQINDFKFLSKLDEVLLNIITFRKYKDEAFKIFIKIPRTDIFIFNQLLIGKTYIVYNLEKFIEEYNQYDNKKDWIFDKYYDRKHLNITEDEENLFNNFIKAYKTVDTFVTFINSLHFFEYRTNPNKLNQLLEYWYKINPGLFYDLCKNGLSQIIDINAIDIIDRFMLSNKINNFKIEHINEYTELKELKTYVEISFKHGNLIAYEKLMEIFKKSTIENIKWFEDNSLFNIYRILNIDISKFDIYKPYIHSLLDLVIDYRFTPSIYLIFILEVLEKNNISFELIKEKIRRIFYISSSQEDIKEIETYKEHDLKKIFQLLNYSLDDIFARIFLKLYFNGKLIRYNKEDRIEECYLFKEYIKNYEDYKMFIQLVLYYYNNFTYTIEKERLSKDYKIDINYFFSGLKNENFINYIKELINSVNKYELNILLKVIPITPEYKELFVDVLNLLESEIVDEEIIALLTKNIYPKKEYEAFLNERNNLGFMVSPFDVAKDEVNKQINVFDYVLNNLSANLSVLNEIEKKLNELKEIKNMVEEISLEYTIR